jgi:hypothetical protein
VVGDDRDGPALRTEARRPRHGGVLRREEREIRCRYAVSIAGGKALDLLDRRHEPVGLCERGGRLFPRVAGRGSGQDFEPHPQRGQRRAQLVRDVRGELPLAAERVGDTQARIGERVA